MEGLNMFHFMMDAYKGYRSHLDDIRLIYEFLEKVPAKMGFDAVMPPFVLPYYSGVVPEDCGISAFVFLAGGHFTIHTFSFREAFFVDLLYPEPYDDGKLKKLLDGAFPSEIATTNFVDRNKKESFSRAAEINEASDFGPHMFLDFKNYQGPETMDNLFELFDTLPYRIGMTPIIRPYAVKSKINNKEVLSILTMIAESHISFHYFTDTHKAYMDLFSCRFFNCDEISAKLKAEFNSDIDNEILISRGSKYRHYRNVSNAQDEKSKTWLQNI